MILPSSHSPSGNHSVAGNEDGCERTSQGWNSRGVGKLLTVWWFQKCFIQNTLHILGIKPTYLWVILSCV